MTRRPIMASTLWNTDPWLNWKIMPSMKANGFKVVRSGRVREGKFGLMDPCTKAGGKITKPMAKVDSFMQMEMSTMASGKTIRLMVSVSIVILTEPNTRAPINLVSFTGTDL